MTFRDLEISDKILRAVDAMGFTRPTAIQEKSIPLIMRGFDVIGRSNTGTGKTVAFGIPVVEDIDTKGEKYVQALILCPTRELAMQGASELRKLTKFCEGVRVADVYGGAPMDRQIAALKRANIVIGTPGRVMDHMRRRTLKLDRA